MSRERRAESREQRAESIKHLYFPSSVRRGLIRRRTDEGVVCLMAGSIEQRAMSVEWRAKSNEWRAESIEQTVESS